MMLWFETGGEWRVESGVEGGDAKLSMYVWMYGCKYGVLEEEVEDLL